MVSYFSSFYGIFVAYEISQHCAFLIISWTAETVENFLPSVSVSKTEITKMLSQYSRVMMCVSTIMLLILATVWGLHTCEFLVIKKSCLLTCVSDTQKGGRKFSTVSAV